MSSQISHVFFDFFGTLVEYDPGIHPEHHNAPLVFAREYGGDQGAESVNDLWLHAWTSVEARAIETGRECSMEEIAAAFARSLGVGTPDRHRLTGLVDDYLEAWSRDISLVVDAAEALSALSGTHQLTIVSNTHHPTLVQEVAERLGIRQYFPHIVTSIEVGWRKPHPHIFEHALARTGARATDVMFVGDNWEADIEGPARMGMSPWYVGTATPGRPRRTLSELVEHVV